MADQEKRVTLYGRVFITGDIKAVTGLHIGGAAGALEVGGVDAPVIRDPLTNRPYIPGSSLRGKMRSLTEKMAGCAQNFSIGKGVHVHVCKTAKDDQGQELLPEQQPYNNCLVCPIFGVPGDQYTNAPTRLVVRDVFMSDTSTAELKVAQTDLPYSEVKWEATIDRVTSAAVPRQIERVPAGTEFENFEMVYSIYHEDDVARLITLVEAMQLLEDDYLGGLGSRGSGKVAFQKLAISARSSQDYGKKIDWPLKVASVAELLEHRDHLLTWVQDTIATG
ncbi:MAG: type III-A CRISPR-associated RAMP protein Csm3 [Chloroflexota bacterium]|nr:type III-A CRISPR-associated RAMP protein Csm3 [Chloroflexota bacterium]